MREDNLSHLKLDNTVIPLSTPIKGWEDGQKKWQEITYTNTLSYFIHLAASDGEVRNNLESSEAYQYLHPIRLVVFCLTHV